MKKVTIPFFISHQGCLNSCIFCDQRTISGSTGKLPTADEIITKINIWRQTSGNRPLEVAFFGGTFTALSVTTQEQLLHPLQNLLASGEINSVRISTRPDYIDGPTVKRLKQQGISTIELGVQSMDNDVLELSGRGHSAAASYEAICCIKDYGLAVGAQLMPGLPGDTPTKSINSLKSVVAAGVDFIRLYPAIVLRGTELAQRFLSGEYVPLTIEEGVQLCKILLHESLRASVPVIRIGLQADDCLNSITVLGGSWHPSLGLLTRSELYYDLLCKLLSGMSSVLQCTILCNPMRVSEVNGLGRVNLKRLGNQWKSLHIKTDNTLRIEELVVDNLSYRIRGNIITDLHYTINKE